MRAGSDRRFNVGRVLVLINPPAQCHVTTSERREGHRDGGAHVDIGGKT